MSTVKRDTTTYDGMEWLEDGRIACAGCHNPEAELTMVMHMDGDTWYSSTYKCECGNTICVSSERDEDDMMRYNL